MTNSMTIICCLPGWCVVVMCSTDSKFIAPVFQKRREWDLFKILVYQRCNIFLLFVIVLFDTTFLLVRA